MTQVRVLVAEDSLTVRRHLCGIVSADPGLTLVGEAENGKRAVELCQRFRPDVISMDLLMPVMSGFLATEYIMAHCPTPILVVSSSQKRDEVFRTFDALAAGAVDVLDKPEGGELPGGWEQKYAAALKLVSRIRVVTRAVRARRGLVGSPVPEAVPRPPARRAELVAIGASTGGPAAILEILCALPAHFRLPVLVVLHIDAPFAASFADWLDRQTGRRAACAEGGESLESLAGRIALAPPDRHMVLRDGRLALTRDPARHSCRPSVDALFESIARSCGANSVACLLTGMGSDGAAGLLEIRAAGGLTIAQDAGTSVIYGMPRAAAMIGAAERELPLSQIGPALAGLAEKDPEAPA